MKYLPLLLALQAMDSGLSPIPKSIKDNAPKNKYNLDPEEVNHLSTLSPKEKKIYLRLREKHRRINERS